MKYAITPVPKPRMTRSDKWKKRDCVLRYRAFCDEVRAAGIVLPECGARVWFVLPMPKSWSEKKKAAMDGKPHKQAPDLDNIFKALGDALFDDDSHIHGVEMSKEWGREGAIFIEYPLSAAQ